MTRSFWRHLHSVRGLFLLFMALLIVVVAVPLVASGIHLMEAISSQYGTELLAERLDALIRPVDRRYARLERMGLEDDQNHRREILDDALHSFVSYRYKNTGTVFVITQAGKPLVAADFSGPADPLLPGLVRELRKRREGVIHYVTGQEERLAVYRYYAPWQAYVGIGIDAPELFEARNTFIEINLAVLAGVLFLGLLGLALINHFVIQPLIQLTEYSADVAEGRYDVPLEGRFHLEFRVLRNALRDMAQSIRQRERERDGALAAMQTSEARLKAILDNTTSLVFLKDLEGRYITVNRQFERISNTDRDELEGRTDADLFPAEVTGELALHDRLVAEQGSALEFEEHLPHADAMHTYITVKFPLLAPSGRPYAIGGVSTDITERKRAEENLAAEQERLSVTLRSIGDGVVTTDTRGRVVLLNRVAEELTGWTQTEAEGRSLEEIFRIVDEKTRAIVDNPAHRALRTGQIVALANHTVLLAKDGVERCIADSAAPIRDRESQIIGAVLVFRDVTEQKRMEEELLKAKKLESVGLLAGGIAHDFNNILTAIQGNLDLALHLVEPTHRIRGLVSAAEKASERARGLTQQLLTFSKGGDPVREAASIEEVIRDSAHFVLRGSNVACQPYFPEGLWLVDIDRGQMSQVIQNIILNAAQAMPDGGVIDIVCENLDNRPADRALGLPEGRFLKIAIADQGIGIPPRDLDKIFDPYFSTKAHGNGLGLAITHGIIAKHDGHIKVRSEEGRGTTFTIYLPASETPAVASRGRRAPDIAKGTGRVLLMDDEEMVRDVARDILEHLGYEVLTSRDGQEALAAYEKARSEGRPVDVVIMDLTIPGGMGGKEAVRALLEMDPKARVIVSSGYSNDPVMADFRAHGFRNAVVKPYQVETLATAVREVLQDGGEKE